MNKIIRTSQAAKILGVSRHQITYLIRAGTLKASRPANAGLTTGYRIDIDDVHELLHERTALKTEKQCPRCKQIKLMADFNLCPGRKDGHRSYCRACQKDIYQANREHILIQKKQYLEQNREKIAVRRRKRYWEHRSAIMARRKIQYAKARKQICAHKRQRYATDVEYRERKIRSSREYVQKNLEKVRQAARVYFRRHKKQIAIKKQAYYRKHRAKQLRRNRQYYKDHSDIIRQQNAQWRRENQDKVAMYEAKRRARKLLSSIEGQPVDQQAIIERDNATCYLCGQGPLDPSEIHLDHVIPLGKGGSHTPENLKVACRSCNCSKQDKSLDEFLQIQA